MSWNYRLIRRPNGPTPHEDEPYFFAIHEVYYDKKGKVEAWSADPIHAGGTTFEALRGDLTFMVGALSKPVLEEYKEDASGKERLREVRDIKVDPKLRCSVCKKPVMRTPGGYACEDGHGGCEEEYD
jgi:hypothetical protein